MISAEVDTGEKVSHAPPGGPCQTVCGASLSGTPGRLSASASSRPPAASSGPAEAQAGRTAGSRSIQPPPSAAPATPASEHLQQYWLEAICPGQRAEGSKTAASCPRAVRLRHAERWSVGEENEPAHVICVLSMGRNDMGR